MALPEFNNLTFFALLAAAGSCWRQLFAFFQRLRSLAVVRVEVEDICAQHVVRHCWTHFWRSPIGDRRYSSLGLFVRPIDRHIQVAIERPPLQPIVFWKGWRPILVSAGAQTEYMGGGVNNNRLTLTFLRGTFDLDLLIGNAVEESNELARGKTGSDGQPLQSGRRFAVHRVMGRDRNLIYQQSERVNPAAPPQNSDFSDGRFITDRILRWKAEDIGPRDPEDPLEAYAFPPEVEELIKEATRWKASEKWFKEKRIPWRRGWMLFSAPGNGKSSLIRAVGQLLDVPIYVFDLATLSNEEMVSHWKRMLANTPAIAAMEDVDNCFHGRENVSGTKGGLTFDCLLNVISGIEESDGVFTIVTTNDIAQIDPALGIPQGNSDAISTRPGRLDRAVELKGMTEACRRKLARRILADCPQHIEATVAAGSGDSGAQFTARCGQLALKEYWNDQELSEFPPLPTLANSKPSLVLLASTLTVDGFDHHKESRAMSMAAGRNQ